MAYDGGYGGGQQRPYAGSSAQPPAPRGYGERQPPRRQYDGPPGGYAGGGGYGQDNGNQYQDPGYGGGQPPPQDRYGQVGGGRPSPQGGARGGAVPMGRPSTADPHRGPGGPPPRGGMGPPGGRGMPPPRADGRPYPRQPPPNLDFAGGNQAISKPPASPRGPGYSGSGYQSRDGHNLARQMSAMELNGQGRGPPMNGRGPPPRAIPQGYPGGRRGPPDQAHGGYGDYDDGYGQQQGPPGHEFGVQRSMTMPVNMEAAAQGMPRRPSAASSHRPPSHQTYSSDHNGPPHDQYGGPDYHSGHGYTQSYAATMDDVYDSYYDDSQASTSDYDSHAHGRQSSRSSMPDFDAIPLHDKRASFEQSMRPAQEQVQPIAQQTPTLSHARSMVDLRQPQSAVFEMAGDAPEVPAIPPMHQRGSYDLGFNGPGSYNQPPIPRGPSAPPGPVGRPGFANNGPINRPSTAAPSNPDSLPAHPTPVRPGQMDNSINPNVKPPPVRNYGGIPQAGPVMSQYQLPPQQQQQQQQQYGRPPNTGTPGPQPPTQAPQRQQQRESQHPVTPIELEQLRMAIKSNSNDQVSALRLAKRLIEASDVLVQNMADPRARAKARERYLVDAQKVLKKLSQSQNPEAMFTLADGVGKGLFGAEPDTKEAFTLYQSAAKLGHPAAAYRTAVCCEIGHEEGGGTRKDPLKAIQWYKRAATLGDPPAMYKVGMILLKGLLGQPKNPREAVGWLKRASERADAENPHALHELGLLYESAQGNDVIIRDEAYAFSLFEQAAEIGYKFSQFRLGCAYEYGLMGCPIDPRLSIVWYSKAATQEEHQSELALSGWYLTGSEGVLGQSDTEAYLWARKAAIAGLAKAEYAMGYFTEVGIGVPANLEDAKRWYWRAAAQDFPKARERLEDLKRSGKGQQSRPRERISRSQKQQEGDCVLM